MFVLHFILAAIILVWRYWPRIQQWNFDRKLMRNHRRWQKNRVLIPRHYSPVVEWENYFRYNNAPNLLDLLMAVMDRCVDDNGKPLPEYQPVYDIIYQKVLEWGFKPKFNHRKHAFKVRPL